MGNGGGAGLPEAFRWTRHDGWDGLGDLPGGDSFGGATAASNDGSTIVGFSSSGNACQDCNEAFVWTADDGMVGLGDLPGGDFGSLAWDVSRDGGVIVGQATGTEGVEAMRWTAENGMVGLGDLPGGAFTSSASGVSADGRTIVGNSNSAPGFFGFEAAIWRGGRPVRSIKEMLQSDFGLDLTGWLLLEANAVSPEGTVIVGLGLNPAGEAEGWAARIPEPTALTSLLAGLLLTLPRNRRPT